MRTDDHTLPFLESVRDEGERASSEPASVESPTARLRRLVDANYDVVWVCGTATLPTGVSAPTGTVTTSVSAAYLPNSCHA